MPLKIVKCEEPTIISFCNNILKEDCLIKHTSIEETKCKEHNILVVGKIIKVLSFLAEAERYVLLIKEFLPSHKYGEKFKALVEGSLARELTGFSPQTGDRVAFFEPLVFFNPAYEPEKSIESKIQPKYLLQSKHNGTALMWFAKKQEMGGKSDDEKGMKQRRSPEKGVEHNIFLTSRQRLHKSLPGTAISGENLVPRDECTNAEHTSSKVRQKPIIQLPQKPQIPINTKRLNPQYTYKTISSIMSGLPSQEQSVNFFGVVHEILKPLSITTRNKHTMVCSLIDDSSNEGGSKIKFHFFTSEDTVLKQIEVGDVLRLHRVKLEKFKDLTDGRVFFSHDVVVFKQDWPDIRPITTAKNTTITDDEKKTVKTLRNWYSDYLRRPTLLSDICRSGKYCIFCKVVKCEPKIEGSTVKITVTDGSAITSLVPAYPLLRYKQKKEGKKDHIVTEIISHVKLDEYARLKIDDFVLFSDVEVVQLENEMFRLQIKSDTSPEIEVTKTLQVSDIECRIEQYIKSLNKNTEYEEKSYSHIIEQESETSVRTRQQKDKQKYSPAKMHKELVPSNCDNEPKDDSDTRNTESDPGTKSRKQLFTPNYQTDLSDAATDETSEHNIDMSKHSKKQPDEEVVNPANTSFNDIIEKVKTKYCTKKDQSQCLGQRSSCRKVREHVGKPLVLQERLCDSESLRKRGRNTPELEDDIDEDAETVVNISQTNNVNRSSQGIKRTRLELSTEEGNPRNLDANINLGLENRSVKVTDWLLNPNNELPTSSLEDISSNEFDLEVMKQILCGDSHTPDLSKYTSSQSFRTQAVLLEVNPDPSSNPLDLVSGYCHSGCQRVFLFSTIKWLHGDKTTTPQCPECFQLELERELTLMLMMELIIMDARGHHRTVLALKNHAELFLNCSVEEYVKDNVVRKSRVQLLTDYTMQKTYRGSYTPLLDIGVVPFKNASFLILVNSTLKLPRL